MWPFLIIIPPPLGQPHSIFGGTSACWLFPCFHNPPNPDMDYRFSNHSLSYASVYTRGLGTPTASQHYLFDLEKLKVFLVLLTGFKPLTFGSPVQCSNHSANPSPLLHFKWTKARWPIGGKPLSSQGKIMQHSVSWFISTASVDNSNFCFWLFVCGGLLVVGFFLGGGRGGGCARAREGGWWGGRGGELLLSA